MSIRKLSLALGITLSLFSFSNATLADPNLSITLTVVNYSGTPFLTQAFIQQGSGTNILQNGYISTFTDHASYSGTLRMRPDGHYADLAILYPNKQQFGDVSFDQQNSGQRTPITIKNLYNYSLNGGCSGNSCNFVLTLNANP